MHPAGLADGDQVGGSQVFDENQGLGGSQSEAFEKARNIKNIKAQIRNKRYNWESSNVYKIFKHIKISFKYYSYYYRST